MTTIVIVLFSQANKYPQKKTITIICHCFLLKQREKKAMTYCRRLLCSKTIDEGDGSYCHFFLLHKQKEEKKKMTIVVAAITFFMIVN
jgi:hypothetical protein